MSENAREISLGFTDGSVPEGTHLCLVFTDEDERTSSLLKFMLSGLRQQERVACFSDHITEDEARAFLEENGISYDERKAERAVSLSRVGEVYFEGGVFDPERMLSLLTDFYTQAKKDGISGARVIGEMTPEVENVPGGERLLEYEARVSMLVQDYPITAVCQYDANEFDGATIMDVLKVHPKMLVNGAVVSNPFFIEPETFLNNLSAQ